MCNYQISILIDYLVTENLIKFDKKIKMRKLIAFYFDFKFYLILRCKILIHNF